MIDTRDLLLHPVRLRIVQALVGSPMTPQQLKQQLGDVAQATLYRHLNQLSDGGLIEVVQERPVRGGVERTYGVKTAAVSLAAADIEDATADDHFRYFATFVGTLLDDFATYLETSERDFVTDRVGYHQVPLWLTDDEFDAVLANMRDAVQEHLTNEPAPGRRRRLVNTIIMPDDRASNAMPATPEMALRPTTDADVEYIQRIVYEAISWNPSAEIPPIEMVVAHPEFLRYHDDWGRNGDAGVLVVVEGEVVAGAFYRCFSDDDHGHGYVDADTPEIAIAVWGASKGAGIGAMLLEALHAMAAQAGFTKLSLSVDSDNPAIRLYERSGYVVESVDEGGTRMIKKISPR